MKLQENLNEQIERHREFGLGGGKRAMIDVVSSFGVLGVGDAIHVMLAEGIFNEDLVFKHNEEFCLRNLDKLRRKFALPCKLPRVPLEVQKSGRLTTYLVTLGRGVGKVEIQMLGNHRIIMQEYLVSNGMDDSGYGPSPKKARVEGDGDKSVDETERIQGDQGRVDQDPISTSFINGLRDRGLVIVSERDLVTKEDLLEIEERLIEEGKEREKESTKKIEQALILSNKPNSFYSYKILRLHF